MKEKLTNTLRRIYNPVWRKKQRLKYVSSSEISIPIRNNTFKFDISNKHSRDWFLPRYADGSVHETPLTLLLLDKLSEETIFFDVGAHIGYFSGVAAAISENVHAFEMNPALIEIISDNIELNKRAGVHTVNCTAVSQHSGQFVGFETEITENLSTAKVSNQGTVRVPTTSLDDYCDIVGEYPNIIKIDVEGNEVDVLQGAKHTLTKTTTEVVMVETHPKLLKRNEQNPHKIAEILESADFHCKVFDHRDDRATLTPVSDLSDRKKPFYIVGQ